MCILLIITRCSKLFHEYVVSSEKSCCCLTLKGAVCFLFSHLAPRRPRLRPRLCPRADLGGGGGGMSLSLSHNSASCSICFGLATAGRGVVMPWQRSAVKGRILSYRYHCLASSPFGWMTAGIIVSLGNFLQMRHYCRNRLSANSWTRTVVDPSATS